MWIADGTDHRDRFSGASATLPEAFGADASPCCTYLQTRPLLKKGSNPTLPARGCARVQKEGANKPENKIELSTGKISPPANHVLGTAGHPRQRPYCLWRLAITRRKSFSDLDNGKITAAGMRSASGYRAFCCVIGCGCQSDQVPFRTHTPAP